MNHIDIIILILAIISGTAFMFLGIQRLFNMYIGFTLGFFIFLSLSLKIDLLSHSSIENVDFILKNIYENKDFYLTFCIITLPIYGIVFSALSPKSDKSLVAGGLFGFLLPFLFVGIIAYIGTSLGNNFYLNEFFYNYLIGSSIFDFFSKNIEFCFYLIFFLVFGKVLYYLGKILVIFAKWYSNTFYKWLVNSKEAKRKAKLEDMINKHKM